MGDCKKDIMKWWSQSFPGMVSVRSLQNDFLFIECKDSTLRSSIIYGSPIFYLGSTFHLIEWKPGFDPDNYRIRRSPIWLSLVGLPSEYWCMEALLKIRDALGALVGIEEDFLTGKHGDVANMC